MNKPRFGAAYDIMKFHDIYWQNLNSVVQYNTDGEI